MSEEIAKIDARLCESFPRDEKVMKGTGSASTCDSAVPLSTECGVPQQAFCSAGRCAYRLRAP